MNNQCNAFVQYLIHDAPTHNKESVERAVMEKFSLTKDRKVYHNDYFAVRFSYSKSSSASFSNTVLSLSALEKYDKIPFFVVLVRQCADNMVLLANSTFIKKISHSSQELSMTNIKGSFNGSDQNCCVNNLPRTFMDIASSVVTRDASGVYYVNFYADATVELDGVRFEISGNYPVGSTVRVAVSKPVEVRFHRPAWCPKMDVARDAKGYVLSFDMNPRLVERVCAADPRNAKSEDNWGYKRYREYSSPDVNRDLQAAYRTTDAAQVMWGPLVLTKTRLLPETTRSLIRDDSSVCGKGYVVKVTPMKPEADVWGQWRVELSKPGAPTISVRAADYASGTDVPICENADLFSIWF